MLVLHLALIKSRRYPPREAKGNALEGSMNVPPRNLALWLCDLHSTLSLDTYQASLQCIGFVSCLNRGASQVPLHAAAFLHTSKKDHLKPGTS